MPHVQAQPVWWFRWTRDSGAGRESGDPRRPRHSARGRGRRMLADPAERAGTGLFEGRVLSADVPRIGRFSRGCGSFRDALRYRLPLSSVKRRDEKGPCRAFPSVDRGWANILRGPSTGTRFSRRSGREGSRWRNRSAAGCGKPNPIRNVGRPTCCQADRTPALRRSSVEVRPRKPAARPSGLSTDLSTIRRGPEKIPPRTR